MVESAGQRGGLDRLGIASPHAFEDVRATMDDRLGNGLAGKLTFTYKDPGTATTPLVSFPWARSLVVGLRSYLPEAGPTVPRRGYGRVARFAVSDPYEPLRSGLQCVATALEAEGFRAEVVIDDDRLVDRAVAVRAGIGWWGKSTMVLTPGIGPWFVIGSVVTDAGLEPDPPMIRTCGSCVACVPACPTGALSTPGTLDARRCLAAIAQSAGIIPRQWRQAMGDRLYGCDDCLDACPPGVRAATREGPQGGVSIEWVLTAADTTLMESFSHFYLPGRRPRIIRRNALVVAGNQPGAGLERLVSQYVGHPDWILRAHAVWALARIGGEMTRPVLVDQLRHESHADVLTELHHEL
ncbi:tRNA epoxyqueuosine(34) reductase QueG [soil metagenome]